MVWLYGVIINKSKGTTKMFIKLEAAFYEIAASAAVLVEQVQASLA